MTKIIHIVFLLALFIASSSQTFKFLSRRSKNDFNSMGGKGFEPYNPRKSKSVFKSTDEKMVLSYFFFRRSKNLFEYMDGRRFQSFSFFRRWKNILRSMDGKRFQSKDFDTATKTRRVCGLRKGSFIQRLCLPPVHV